MRRSCLLGLTLFLLLGLLAACGEAPDKENPRLPASEACLTGRVAAVMLGSTETTFYTIAVYFGAVGISRTRYAVPAALCADLTGFLAAAWAVRLCFGGG